jgi:hypothetical protein
MPTVTVTLSATPSRTRTPGLGNVWHCITPVATFQPRMAHASVVFNNYMWVLGGHTGASPIDDASYSADGSNWLSAGGAKFTPRYGHSAVVFDPDGAGAIPERIYVIAGREAGGEVNTVYFSSDGGVWYQSTNPPFEPRYCHASVVYDGKIWVIGGKNDAGTYFNDAWYTEDGINWTAATRNAAFSARWGHAAILWGGAVYIYGGTDASGLSASIYHSADGIAWTGEGNGSFGARYRQTAVNRAGSCFMAAGSITGTKVNDVWASAYGFAFWGELTAAAEFTPRDMHTMLVFDDDASGERLWIIGGSNPSNQALSDVWWSR